MKFAIVLTSIPVPRRRALRKKTKMAEGAEISGTRIYLCDFSASNYARRSFFNIPSGHLNSSLCAVPLFCLNKRSSRTGTMDGETMMRFC